MVETVVPTVSVSPKTRTPVLHRIRDVREQQGISLRTAARNLGLEMRTVRAQEEGTADLHLSDLYRWQEALEVPISELLVEDHEPLSRPVMERAHMLRVMKTAKSILEKGTSPVVQRLATMLVEQLSAIMPELTEVTPWNSVGHRRSSDELGRIAEQPITISIAGDE
jgi:transcriptional regulator with XRE-family HTH domain